MMTALVDRLNGVCDAVPFHVGWYLEDLGTGERRPGGSRRHGDVVVPSASTRKIAILIGRMARAAYDALSP